MLVSFVDDTFIIWPHGHPSLISFFDHLNSISPNIQFTMEMQKDNSLPFLDVLISQLPDGSLTHQVYRKNMHTDRYLHAHSHHHPTQKSVVLKTLVTHAIQISTPQFLEKEKSHLTQALKANGYSISQINKSFCSTCHSKSKNPPTSSPPLAHISLPYIF
jgi:hypothetical protein